MAADVGFDVLEQILIRLDVKDIIRCKSVCKSWQSFINHLSFVKAHLKHSYKNDACRRISSRGTSFYCNDIYIAGSCNGLVCVCPIDVELVITNPWTRETKKLRTPFHRPAEKLVMIREVVCCMGFGYDCYTDDYKVIVGFRDKVFEERTLFHVLTLKTNTWKVIGEVKYADYSKKSGILCGGALYWFMCSGNKKVIISVDLSTEECKEIPQPAEAEREGVDFFDHKLGIIEECLCIYSSCSPSPLSSKIWVMKNKKWELYNTNNNNHIKYDVAHTLKLRQVVDSHNKTSYVYIPDYGRLVPSFGDHTCANIFVKSLVSPYPRRQTKEQLERNDVKGNKRKRKRKRKRSSSSLGLSYQ